METNKETRSIPTEIRLKENSRIVEGYAIKFNSESEDLGGFTEIILPEAVDGVIEQSDIFALLNHDKSRGVLARSKNGKGSMKITTDKNGVLYSFEAPKFDLGNELVEGIMRGDISGSSFGFIVKEDKWIKRDNNRYLREIHKFEKITDMSPVYIPAYTDAKVALRNFEEAKKTQSPEPGSAKTDPEPTEIKQSKKLAALRELNTIYKLKNLHNE